MKKIAIILALALLYASASFRTDGCNYSLAIVLCGEPPPVDPTQDYCKPNTNHRNPVGEANKLGANVPNGPCGTMTQTLVPCDWIGTRLDAYCPGGE